MNELTTEAAKLLDDAQGDVKAAFDTVTPGSKDERDLLATGAVVAAISALCHEVAALRCCKDASTPRGEVDGYSLRSVMPDAW